MLRPSSALGWGLAALLATAPSSAAARASAAQAWLAQAEARQSRGDQADLRAALTLYRRAARAAARTGAAALEARALAGLAETQSRLGEPRQALAGFQAARAAFERLGQAAQAANALTQIGTLHNALGHNDEAERALEQALSEQRALGRDADQAETLNNLAYVCFTRGDNARALELYGQARALREALGDRNLLAQTRNYVAMVQSAMGREREALQEYRASLAIFRELGDRGLEAATLHNAARSRFELGDTEGALAELDQALALSTSLGDRSGMAYVRHTRGLVFGTLGEPAAALRELHAARRSFEERPDPFGLAHVSTTLGRQYAALGDVERARVHFRRALPLLRAQGERPGEAIALHGLALAEAAEGNWAAAERRLRAALALARATQDRGGEAALLCSLGEARRAQGRLDQAVADLTAALDLRVASGHVRGQALALEGLARVEAQRGGSGEALRLLERALVLRRAAADRAGLAQALYAMARLRAQAGDLEAAAALLDDALAEAERLRAGVPSDELRASYLATLQPLFELAVDVRVRLAERQPAAGHLAAAFALAERARARALLDALTRGGVEPWAGAQPELLRELTRVRRRLAAHDRRRLLLSSAPAAADERRALDQTLDALLAEARELTVRLAAQSPRQAALASPSTANLADVQTRLLDDETLLLEYVLGDERSHVFVIARDSVATHTLAGSASLRRAVRRATALLDARRLRPRFEDAARRARRLAAADRAWPRAAAELSRLLLEPLAGRLGTRRLVIVVPGALQEVPFAALPEPGVAGGPPLVEAHEIVAAPSASVLLTLRAQVRATSGDGPLVAVLADPVFDARDQRLRGVRVARASAATLRAAREESIGPLERLPRTRWEAERIRALAPAGSVDVALGFDAARERLDDPRLRAARILHFATHAFVDGRRPELSGLVLSLFDRRGRPRDGVLRLDDVYRLPLSAELVVLSACRTALGREIRGEGLQSLARGFLHAGARRLVASLWSTPDTATAELMTRFYRALLSAGRPPAAALRAAQLALRRDPRFRHARDWAAFTLQGDWQP